MSIDDLWSKIEAKLDNFKQDLDKRIDGLEDSLAAFKTECGISGVRHDVDRANASIGRVEKANELIISGVPYQQNENLVAMFGFIVTRLGCDESKIPLASLARLAKSPIAVGSTPPIICEFALRADRNAFYASYLNHRDLNLSHIGFQNTNRIYVNENLTKEDREIRAAALRLKKEGKVQKVYSRNGIVYAKGRGNAPAEPCPTLDHLAVFR
ncbi:conserved hypothetical protein [Culex quinquefasciatus]|uniref:Uncharacterized protein n=1 Tax=Culex quinquefasciatus TaxID=7176 RepID=B0XFQ3_CULQU|nr:conserved hypothetical protein [Culex quinquefasciatus]|eukprot:XP_001868475.1 conserved hypothetical protein [Culex quinquefasciatus]